ncbi:hypothetical protein GCM10010421_43930 [Streptomyces glaucus]|uniref:Secreted protein n=1 Tax=Streptomyces glaucus TaxID=284029 RepID=A0ABN3K5T1_9ACTN
MRPTAVVPPAEGGSGAGSPTAGGTGTSPVLEAGGDDEWCVAGMTAPVRVNVNGRMTVGRWVLRVYRRGVPEEPSHTSRVGNPALC